MPPAAPWATIYASFEKYSQGLTQCPMLIGIQMHTINHACGCDVGGIEELTARCFGNLMNRLANACRVSSYVLSELGLHRVT